MSELAIVIPAYKATYLKKTLESIAKQTDKRFHLYIGDDCSPYDIERIVQEYKGQIPLTYKRFETNLGGKDLVAQWERCIELTKGESFIWLFSDDDTMDSMCVENFYNSSQINPDEQLFHFNINMIDDLNEGKVKQLPVFPEKLSAGEFLELKLRGKIVSYVVEFIFSRKLYDEVNGFQKFDLAWGSDFITWLKMAAFSNTGIYTVKGKECCVNWRRSSENISPNNSHAILIRKINALIENAVSIKEELINHPTLYYPLKNSFRWLRFPLGEIFRNRKNLFHRDIRILCYKYWNKIGYPIHTLLTYLNISVIK